MEQIIIEIIADAIISFNCQEPFNFHRVYYTLNTDPENNLTLNIDCLLSTEFDYEIRTYISANLMSFKENKKFSNDLDLSTLKECIAYKVTKRNKNSILNRSTLISGLSKKQIKSFISGCLFDNETFKTFKKNNGIN